MLNSTVEKQKTIFFLLTCTHNQTAKVNYSNVNQSSQFLLFLTVFYVARPTLCSTYEVITHNSSQYGKQLSTTLL